MEASGFVSSHEHDLSLLLSLSQCSSHQLGTVTTWTRQDYDTTIGNSTSIAPS